MNGQDEQFRRVRFFGPGDLATGYFLQRAVDLAEQFEPDNAPTSTVDIIELHNVQQYLEHGFFPLSHNEEQQARTNARIPQIRGAVARFFSKIDDTNVATVIDDVAGVRYGYHGDLLELLGRSKAYERCAAATVLTALSAAGVQLGEILGCKSLVRVYDAEVRMELLSSPRGAEHVLRKYLQEDVRGDVHLPRSLTPEDSRALLERYIDGENANPNYVGLIASAVETPAAGVDARLKLRARRRVKDLNVKLFKQNDGVRTGCEVRIADQAEPAVEELDESDGLVCRYTYSQRWLDETSDNPSILNNFINLFGFVDRNGLLVLPSYSARLGVMERLMGTPGRTEYKVGAVFRTTDMSSLLQTRMYHHYLETKGIDLEQVISWFFEDYLVDEFQAENFSFTPSSAGTSYLEKVRHLFAEMESVASQFSLFAKDGELDRDLLAMGTEQVRYKDLPSLLEGNYLYSTETEEIASILNLLFSDQASVTYISEELRGDNGAMLLLQNEVSYDDFHDYQKPAIDHLIELGIVDNDGTRVQLINVEQFRILSALFNTECASYYHLSDRGRAVADAMVDKRWVERRSSLLSGAEGKYFNYFLNAADFSNGPQLRNKYLHGSQVNTEGEDAHFHTYMTALRLTVALVIKMNDDFCLASTQRDRAEAAE